MNLYILHYAAIDEEGHLTIDCQGAFKILEEAKAQQEILLKACRSKYLSYSDVLIEEKCGTFHSIAYKGHLIELQSHIEEVNDGHHKI